MSRIGKKIIELPQKVEISVSGTKVTVKGPKGALERDFGSDVTVSIADGKATVSSNNTSENSNAIWGTFASHLINMIEGVNVGFTKKLIIEGIGFKAEVKGSGLAMSLGLSHPLTIPIPASLKVLSDKGIVTITGNDKEEVGQFAANIRSLKKPEPYKGKGIRYETEVIRRKQGKKAA
jgi:large subunit ribosomal protein L6